MAPKIDVFLCRILDKPIQGLRFAFCNWLRNGIRKDDLYCILIDKVVITWSQKGDVTLPYWIVWSVIRFNRISYQLNMTLFYLCIPLYNLNGRRILVIAAQVSYDQYRSCMWQLESSCWLALKGRHCQIKSRFAIFAAESVLVWLWKVKHFTSPIYNQGIA
jgi:hypothetical protein